MHIQHASKSEDNLRCGFSTWRPALLFSPAYVSPVVLPCRAVGLRTLMQHIWIFPGCCSHTEPSPTLQNTIIKARQHWVKHQSNFSVTFYNVFKCFCPVSKLTTSQYVYVNVGCEGECIHVNQSGQSFTRGKLNVLDKIQSSTVMS